MSEKNFVAYGDAESILTGYANRIKQSPTTFVGTQAQWNALSSSQKAEYELVDITDDSLSPSGHVDWESNGKIGSKNLLPNKATTQTINGVTFTINSDGSVTANGTATSNAEIDIATNVPLNGDYILSDDFAGISGQYWAFANVDNGERQYILTSKEMPITISNKLDYFRVKVFSGVTADNITFKPMIRLATDSDSTYQPYAMTNKELTKQVAPIDDMNNILGAKNILPNHNVTQVIDGITFTVNNDGTVTATGTSTALVVFDVVNTELLSPFKLNSGTYILTDGLTASQYEDAYTALTLKYTDDTVEYNVADTSINKNQFTVDASTIKDWYFGICIRANKTVNITFKPMVRPASIKDATYVPYSKTNSELTVELSNFAPKAHTPSLVSGRTSLAGITGTILEYPDVYIINASFTKGESGTGIYFNTGVTAKASNDFAICVRYGTTNAIAIAKTTVNSSNLEVLFYTTVPSSYTGILSAIIIK